MRKHKILHIIPRLVQGGAEKQLTDYVSDTGSQHEHHVLTLFENNEMSLAERVAALTVRTAQTNLGVAKDLIATRSLVTTIQPDAAVCWLYHAIALAPIIVPTNIPVVAYVHNTDLSNEAKSIERLAQKIGRFGSKRSNQYMLYCGEASRDLHERLGYDDKRASVIPNGISMDRFQNDAARRQIYREELEIPTDAFVFGCFGRFNPQKNWPLIFSAFEAANKKNGKTWLLVAGSGVNKDNVAFQDLIPAHLENQVIALGDQTNMAQLYDAIDVLLMASSYGESFPLVLLEALAMGKPAIATSLGSIPSIIKGLFEPVPVGEDTSFIQIAEDAAVGAWPGIKTPAKMMRDKVLANYSLTAYTQRLDGLLASIVSE